MAIASYADASAFLHDGLAAQRSPALLLDLAIDQAADLLQRAMQGELRPYLPLAAPESGLYAVDCRRAVDFTEEDARAYCAELATTGTWTVLHGLEEVIGGGRVFTLLEVLCDQIARGALPPVTAVVAPEFLPDVLRAAPRFAGLAGILDQSTGYDHFTQLNVMTVETEDKADTGWTVLVRLVLQRDVAEDRSIGGQAAADALDLIDDELRIVAVDERRPEAVLIGFRPGALGLEEQDQALRAAELVCRRLVGRPLVGGEVVEATRAIFSF